MAFRMTPAKAEWSWCFPGANSASASACLIWKPLRKVRGLQVFGCLHKLLDLLIDSVLSGGDLDAVSDGCKEGDFVDKEKVA